MSEAAKLPALPGVGVGTAIPIAFAAQPNSPPAMPTVQAYNLLQNGFTFLNEKLFENQLPQVLITLTRSKYKEGYFCACAFENRAAQTAHEISMNPRYLGVRSDTDSFSTLAHEMCHLARHIGGRPNRKGGYGAGGYHDVVWTEKMIRIGLMPSDTGAPGGKRTGYRVSHYVIEGGLFDHACRELLARGYGFDWRDKQPVERTGGPALTGPADQTAKPNKEQARNTRTRFVCGSCDLRAWSRRSARLSCNECHQPLVAK